MTPILGIEFAEGFKNNHEDMTPIYTYDYKMETTSDFRLDVDLDKDGLLDRVQVAYFRTPINKGTFLLISFASGKNVVAHLYDKVMSLKPGGLYGNNTMQIWYCFASCDAEVGVFWRNNKLVVITHPSMSRD